MALPHAVTDVPVAHAAGTPSTVPSSTTPGDTGRTGGATVDPGVGAAGAAPTIGRFALSSTTWSGSGAAPRVSVRLDGGSAARTSLRVRSTATGRVVLRQTLGTVAPGATVDRALTRRLVRRPGAYSVALVARDAAGHRVPSAAGVPAALAVTVDRATPTATGTPGTPSAAKGAFVFPVQGRCNFRSDPGQRFHAPRAGGRRHNGQDIGTYDGYPPVVAMTASTVDRVWFDDAGGGWTVVMDGDDGIAYGYLHLKPGTIQVTAGQRLVAGQPVANAGRSGGDYEPHLHVEMRPIPWSANAARAVDPLPLLASLPNPCDG